MILTEEEARTRGDPAMKPDGVYFGLPMSEYLDEPRLSSSGVKNLLVSPADFWYRSWLNPAFERRDTEALRIGIAFNTRIVEGADRFWDCYAEAFDESAYPDALRTIDDLKKVLAHVGEKVSGRKADLIERVKGVDPDIEIMDDLKAEHHAATDGKDLLSADLISSIELAAAAIEADPVLRKCFSGGEPEVTVFWTDESGVPWKARFDYLKAQAVIDLKTFTNTRDLPTIKAIGLAVGMYRWDIQAALYLDAIEAAISMWDALPDYEVDTLIDKIMKAERHEFFFVFQQKGGAPITKLLQWNTQSRAHENARAAIDFASQQYLDCMQRFGTDKAWLEPAQAEMLSDEDLPGWMDYL